MRAEEPVGHTVCFFLLPFPLLVFTSFTSLFPEYVGNQNRRAGVGAMLSGLSGHLRDFWAS